MKRRIAFDIKRMKPGCPLVQAGMGGDPRATDAFDPKTWLLSPTDDMQVYQVSGEQLKKLVKMVHTKHLEKTHA